MALHESLMDMDLPRAAALVAEYNAHMRACAVTGDDLDEARPALLWLASQPDIVAAPLRVWAARAGSARRTSEYCCVSTSRSNDDASAVAAGATLPPPFPPGLWDYVSESQRVDAVLALARGARLAAQGRESRESQGLVHAFLGGLGLPALDDVCFIMAAAVLHQEGLGRPVAAAAAFAGLSGLRMIRAVVAGAPARSAEVVEGLLDAAENCGNAHAAGTEECAWLHACCGALHDLSPRHGATILASLGARQALPRLALRLLLLWMPADAPHWIQTHACGAFRGSGDDDHVTSPWLWEALRDCPADAARLMAVAAAGALAACQAAGDSVAAAQDSNAAFAEMNAWVKLLGTVLLLVRVDASPTLASQVGSLLGALARVPRRLLALTADGNILSPATLSSAARLGVWCAVLGASFTTEEGVAAAEQPALDCIEAWRSLRVASLKTARCIPPVEVHAIITLCNIAHGSSSTKKAAYTYGHILKHLARDVLGLPPEWALMTRDNSAGPGQMLSFALAAQSRWSPVEAMKLLSALSPPAPSEGTAVDSAAIFAVSAALLPGSPILEAPFDGHQWLFATLSTGTPSAVCERFDPPRPHPQMFDLIESYVECVSLGAIRPLLPLEVSAVAKTSPASAVLAMFAAMKTADRATLPFDFPFFLPRGCSDLARAAVHFWLREDPGWHANDHLAHMLSHYWPNEPLGPGNVPCDHEHAAAWSEVAWSAASRFSGAADAHTRLNLILATGGGTTSRLLVHEDTWSFVKGLLGQLVAVAPNLPRATVEALSEAWLLLATQSTATETLLVGTVNALLAPSPPLTMDALVQEPLLIISLPEFALQRQATLRVVLVVLDALLRASRADAAFRCNAEGSKPSPQQSAQHQAYCLLQESIVARALLGICRVPDPDLQHQVRNWISSRQAIEPQLVPALLSQGLAYHEVAVLAFGAPVILTSTLVAAMHGMLNSTAAIEANLAGITVAAALCASGSLDSGSQPTLDVVSRCVAIVSALTRSEMCSTTRAVLCASLAEVEILLCSQPPAFRHSESIVAALQVLKSAEFSGIVPASFQSD